jgi:hypothetical protein
MTKSSFSIAAVECDSSLGLYPHVDETVLKQQVWHGLHELLIHIDQLHQAAREPTVAELQSIRVRVHALREIYWQLRNMTVPPSSARNNGQARDLPSCLVPHARCDLSGKSFYFKWLESTEFPMPLFPLLLDESFLIKEI